MEMKTSKQEIQNLIQIALEQRKFSYAPYSHFRVGAALLAADGTVYTGCNIENGAYTPSNCGERTAFFKAISVGVRKFRAICVVGGDQEQPTKFCPPCGVCRQVMEEFCQEDFEIILAVSQEKYEVHTLGELLPLGFQL